MKSKCDYLRMCFGNGIVLHTLKYSHFKSNSKFREYRRDGLVKVERIDKYVVRYSITEAGLEWIKRYSR